MGKTNKNNIEFFRAKRRKNKHLDRKGKDSDGEDDRKEKETGCFGQREDRETFKCNGK